jgi:uncharacterized protein (TIGR02117 family)
MSYRINLRRLGRYAAIALLATISIGVVTSLVPRQWGKPVSGEDCRYTVYITGGTMHTNLIVPLQTDAYNWREALDVQAIGGNPTTFQYLQFGWGDRAWYVETSSWSEINFLSGLRALFLQNPAALFVMGQAQVPRYPSETLKCMRLGQADYQALMQFINRSFQTRNSKKQLITLSRDRAGAFYEATGKYSLLYTCNAWTADALNAANVNTPIWGSFAPAVMNQIRNGCECEGPQ